MVEFNSRSSTTASLRAGHNTASYGSTNDMDELVELIDSDNDNDNKKNGTSGAASYLKIWMENRAFRLYMISFITNQIGEWLTYLASLSAIEKIQFDRGQTVTTGSAIGELVAIRLLPNVFLGPFGGVLADGRDRRKVMIILDLIGGAVAWLFVLAIPLKSIPLIYFATFVQQSVQGLYGPSRSAIVPLMVSDQEELKKATTMTGLAWSVVAAFGAALGGYIVGYFGLTACFMVDCATYLVSAFYLVQLGGKWTVASLEDESYNDQLTRGMITDGISYLYNSFFGVWALFKASASLVYGGFDVLNVAFAERGNLEGRSFRLGALFSWVGFGCWLGPVVFDRFTNMSNARTLQLSCIVSLGVFITGSSLLMGVFSQFQSVCFLSAVRAVGSSVLWIYTTLILQKYSTPNMLGRVSSIETSMALLMESLSAFVAGWLRDDVGMSPEQVSLTMGLIALLLSLMWVVQYCRGLNDFLETTGGEEDDGLEFPSRSTSEINDTNTSLEQDR